MIITGTRMKQDVLLEFQQFLLHAWPALPLWMQDPLSGKEALHDWLQVNWETLVEYPLGVTLLPYADCSEGYGLEAKRIFDPDMPPTHCFLIDEQYLFHSLTAFINGQYQMQPPFDICCAKAPSGEILFQKFQDTRVRLCELKVLFPGRYS